MNCRIRSEKAAQSAAKEAVLKSFALTLACLVAAGCYPASTRTGETSPARVPGQHYAYLFGQRYRTRTDLYLFAVVDELDYKYLGRIDAGAKFGPPELPATVDRANIGREYRRSSENGLGDIVILDVAPAGSVLTIVAETHGVTALSGIRGSSGYPMGFICTLDFDGKHYEGVFSEFIQSHREVTTKIPNEEMNPVVADKINP